MRGGVSQGRLRPRPAGARVDRGDEQRHVERFIRDATFVTNARDFGFIVPTPTRPDVSEVESSTFNVLDAWVASSEPPHKSSHGFGGGTVERIEVAGYDVAILKADDAFAIRAWLESHRYPCDQALIDWMSDYVKRGWYLNAFKVAPGGTRTRLGAVQMAFRTREPFYPYREPRVRRGAEPRRLSVLAISSGPMRASAPAWDRKLVAKLNEKEVAELSTALHVEAKALEGRYGSLFIDPTQDRGAADDVGLRLDAR